MVVASSADAAWAQQAQAGTPPPTPIIRSKAAFPQGFSVVLVLADLQATGAVDDVPAAARKALLDMKDFLPYKSYRLMDAAWVMCCGLRTNDETITQLRGPEDREYELQLAASAAPSDANESRRVAVRFLLRDVSMPSLEGGGGKTGSRSSNEKTDKIEQLRVTVAGKEVELAALRRKYSPNHASVVQAEKELAAARRQLELEEHAATVGGLRPALRTMRGRNIIDTSFSMAVDETVVVGTSRLRSGSKALIALLTAVPPRGSATDKRE